MRRVSIYGRDITSHTASEDRVRAPGADAAYGGLRLLPRWAGAASRGGTCANYM